MVQNKPDDNSSDKLDALYRHSRFEVLPFNSVIDKLSEVPFNTNLTVTCSPNQTIEQTLLITRKIQAIRSDLTIIPHIAARMLENDAHLDTVIEALSSMHIDQIFIPGGDVRMAKGRFSAALEALETLAQKDSGISQIGITGYPEGHHLISDQILWQNLEAKSEYANYIVTQICFDVDTILDWIGQLRKRKITLPVFIGIPSVIERKKLLEISLKLGIGKSISFLKKQSGFFKQLFRSQPFQSSAQPIFDKVTTLADDADLNIKGFHVFTFNQLQTTFKWWHLMTS